MSALEPKIYTLLAADNPVKGLVGTRIYPMILPQDPVLPAITYQRISGGQVNSMAGYGGLENPRVQIDVMASTYAGCKTLAGYVFTAMEGSTTFQAVMISDQDIHEPELECFRISMDFSTW